MTRWPGARRAFNAFTLVEMLVALAVTVVALGIVTIVFNVTTKTATQAAAAADVQAQVRNFLLTVEEDLKNCDPADSILVLVGRAQGGALTQDDLTAGKYHRVLTGNPATAGTNPEYSTTPPAQYSDPRADLLMFFSGRPSVSQAPPTSPINTFEQQLLAGAKISPIQVVYGHAAFDDVVGAPGSYGFAGSPRHIETTPNTNLSPIPVGQWHLARRVTIIAHDTGDVSLTNDIAEMASIARCYRGDPRWAGDVGWLDMDLLLGPLAPWGFSNPALVQASQGPYTIYGGLAGPMVNALMYAGGSPTPWHHVATVLTEPPAALRSNLGLHMLPGCAWFQVEFLMPEDPRNGLDSPLADQRNDMPRWVEVPSGGTYVFVPDTAANRDVVASLHIPGSPSTGRLADFAQVIPPPPIDVGPDIPGNRRIRMWPYAIRVTVRVYDVKGRLEAAVVRSLVHRFD